VVDPDTFDTWFSSGQWPFVTLNYSDGMEYKNFYPTSVMETAADILMFWVLRMIMLGIYVTGDVPFENVYLHGLVRDKKGQKMSKSKGNVTAPSEVADVYGTDALRMGLVVGNTPGTNMNLDPQKIGAYKKFANKLWNISRFIYDNTNSFSLDSVERKNLSDTDRAYIDELIAVKADVAQDIESFRIHLGAEKAYHYVWHTLADHIIEASKDALLDKTTSTDKAAKQYILLTLLGESLMMLHPFMPFITEEIWKDFPASDKDLLMVTHW
jgi:valyl-tRNA synthetase